MTKRISIVIPILLFFQFLSFSAVFKSGFLAQKVASGLVNPTAIDIAPDGRIFITEKSGKVRIIENGVLLPEPVLSLKVDEYNERGLGGIVLHPNFDKNGYFYVYYNIQNQNRNALVRYQMNGNKVLPGSDFKIFDFPELTGAAHNGGAMKFDSLGYLFVAVGEGGNHTKGQQLTTVLGKILRLNDDGTIPIDNPFYNTLEGQNRAIYAYGLRNPYSFDIDPLTQKIFVNDVGEASWEEINNILPGKNYGWSEVEGNLKEGVIAPNNYMDPFYTYSHDAGCAVVGGVFYNPKVSKWPEIYKNTYIFSDYCSGMVSVLDLNSKTILDTLVKWGSNPTNFMIGNDGALYMLEFNSGDIWKIDFTGDGKPFVLEQPKNNTIVKNETVELSVQVMGDDPLVYQWFKNNEEIINSNSYKIILIDENLNLNNSKIFCKISNAKGHVFSDTILIKVQDNTRPTIVFQKPILNSNYNAGDTLYYEAYAIDAEDGILDVNNLSWKIDFQHNEHFHPILPWTKGINNGYVVVPRVGELDTNVYFNITLKATDLGGIETISSRRVYPNLVTVHIKSNINNSVIKLDGTPIKIPYTFRGVVGGTRIISTSNYIPKGDSLLKFLNWNGNEELLREFNLPQNDTTINVDFEFVDRWFEGSGQGLIGKYKEGNDLNVLPSYTKIDPEINFFWDWGSPEKLSSDNFCVTWVGKVLAPVTGEYTIYFKFDDFGKITIDGNIIFNNWGGEKNSTDDSLKIFLIGGTFYSLTVDMGERLWQSKAILFWKVPYINQIEIIPSKNLFPVDIINNLSSKNETLTEKISVYPSITESELKIYSEEKDLMLDFQIYNSEGKLMLNGKNQVENQVIDVSMLLKGIYYIQLISNEQLKVSTFIKE